MMTTVPAKPQSIFEQAIRSQFESQIDDHWPLWFTQSKQQGFEQFNQLGLPSRRSEQWRFIDLSAIANETFTPPAETREDLFSTVAKRLYTESKDTHLVFINGRYQPEYSRLEGLPSGVVVLPLSQALQTHADKLATVFSKESLETPDGLSALNTALAQEGVFIEIPDNVVVTTPIQLLYFSTNTQSSPTAAYYKGIVIAQPNSQVNLIANYVGLNPESDRYLTNAVLSIHAAPGAHVGYWHIQEESQQAYQFASTRAYLQANAQLASTSISFGGRLSRHHLEVKHLGAGSHAELRGLSVLNGQTEVHDYTVVDHTVGHTTTKQLYKGVLEDRSRSEFDGTMVIRKDAQLVDASQLNKNLLLSPQAKVMTRPQLRIDADDVKCAHGATVGQLNENEVFYLKSRGIAEAQARSILTYGFAEDIVNAIPFASVREQLVQTIHATIHV